jgi:hypothetical protein
MFKGVVYTRHTRVTCRHWLALGRNIASRVDSKKREEREMHDWKEKMFDAVSPYSVSMLACLYSIVVTAPHLKLIANGIRIENETLHPSDT